jgi:hypothetical protein
MRPESSQRDDMERGAMDSPSPPSIGISSLLMRTVIPGVSLGVVGSRGLTHSPSWRVNLS